MVMKVWTLDLSPYYVDVIAPGENGSEKVKAEFDVKGSLSSILFNPALNLTVPQAFEAKDLADRIQAASGFVLLDRMDKVRLDQAYNAIRSPNINSLVLLMRIRDMESVEVSAPPTDSEGP